MARKGYVTRSVTATEVTVLAMDVVKAEPLTLTYTVPGNPTNEKKLLKTLRETYDTEEVKVVQITSTKPVVGLYGLPLDKFMEIALPLDPDTRKLLIEDEEAEAEAES